MACSTFRKLSLACLLKHNACAQAFPYTEKAPTMCVRTKLESFLQIIIHTNRIRCGYFSQRPGEATIYTKANNVSSVHHNEQVKETALYALLPLPVFLTTVSRKSPTLAGALSFGRRIRTGTRPIFVFSTLLSLSGVSLIFIFYSRWQ